MELSYKIYLICYHNGCPVDFLLPVYSMSEFTNVAEIAGTCFKIRDPKGAEIMLACHHDNDLHTTRIKVESACKANANISFCIVVDEKENVAYLRAFTDKQCNAFYPLPCDFFEKSRSDS